ncbi:MAG: antibiotic biosynthesis monooxygenase [Ancalomicrobiaceae bacterium]|nr:antibiotic biosynthesis monooxygenase [Ancalomicrobiaceae bacterium]
MTDQSVILVNLLKVEPANCDRLLGLLKQNTETVIRTLAGWTSTRLIAAKDRTSVVIYSEWESAGAVEAMRNDPRMQACFPEISALASLTSVIGATVFSEAG